MLRAWLGTCLVLCAFTMLTGSIERVYGAKLKDLRQLLKSFGVNQKSRIALLTNDRIIDLAIVLDTRLRRPSGVSVSEQKEIARVLISMHRLMEERIAKAPFDDKGYPKLNGISWDRYDPLSGAVESIVPFGMVDWWREIKQRPGSLEVKKLRTPEPSQSARKWPGRSSCSCTRRMSAKACQSLKFGCYWICGPPHWKYCWNTQLKRAIAVIAGKPSLPGRKRNLCILRALEKKGLDDRFISMAEIKAVSGSPNPNLIVSQIDSGRIKLKRLEKQMIYTLATQNRHPDPEYGYEVEWRLHKLVMEPFNHLLRVQGEGVAGEKALRALGDWVRQQQQKTNSIYSCLVKN